MNSRKLILVTAMTLFAALAIPVQLAAQDSKQQSQPEHHHYKMIDMGTFGGPGSFIGFPSEILNSRGMAVGNSETPTLAPPNSNGFPCGPGNYIYHAFEWQNGVLTDLGTLPGGNCSNAQWINAGAEIVGNSETGEIDPALGVREIRAVLWKGGQIMDLGTFGGTESAASAINNRGQVVGLALNALPDPFSFFSFLDFGSMNGTQTRAFLWQHGQMQDLGTLGGPDAQANWVNNRGQVVGSSYTNSTPNPGTGIPTLHTFLWEEGKMLDLGSLGGTVSFPNAANERGQVIGQSTLVGDQTSDQFLWDKGKLTDLSTPQHAGTMIIAHWIDDSGAVVGVLTTPRKGLFHASRWKNEVVTDLGTLPGDCGSEAWTSSSKGQIGGRSYSGASDSCDGSDQRAFMWENGEIIDLNALIPANSNLQLVVALRITERGEIAGLGVPPGVSVFDVETLGHAFLLIPCDENHPGVEGCDYSMLEAPASTPQTTHAIRNPSSRPLPQPLMRRMNRYHFAGFGASRPE